MLENVSITVDDNVPWEIASDKNVKQLPHIINVQCSFKPIQDFIPRRINDDNLNVPFMTKAEENYVSLDNTFVRKVTDVQAEKILEQIGNSDFFNDVLPQ